MGDLKLNEHHLNVLLKYARFSNYQREQCLKSVKESFDNFKLSSVAEDTFTSDEVRDLIEDLSYLVMEDFKSDLVNITHTVILLLCQLCNQAELVSFNFRADTSELENKELLEKVSEFYEKISNEDFEKVTSSSPIKLLSKLKPLTEDAGPNKFLLSELERLREENEKLSLRVKDISGKAIELIEEKAVLTKALEDANAKVLEYTENISIIQEKEVGKMKKEMEKTLKEKAIMQKELEDALAETKEYLLQAEKRCEIKEKELELKFSETIVYQNMKQLISAKNEQIKELRKRLQEFKSPGGDGEDDDHYDDAEKSKLED